MATAIAVFWTAAVATPAAAENRTLDLYYVHTGERAQITFKKNGRYDPAALKQLNHLLRDWRLNQSTRMDPALFDLVWEIYRQSGSRKPITVTSPYRAPATNNMLRRRSRGVAKNSQHTHGKAMDWFVTDVPTSKLRAIALKLQRGGVGYYPNSRTPFVHTDTGSVRHWPRMSKSQLMALFPDGRTLHMAADNKPLAGYKQALNDYIRYKRGLGRADDVETRQLVEFSNSIVSDRDTRLRPSAGKSTNLFAMLFGGGADEEEDATNASGGGDEEAAPAPAAPRATARSAPAADTVETLPGVAASATDDDAPAAPARAPVQAPAEPVVASPPAAPQRKAPEPSAESLLASMTPPSAAPDEAAVLAAMTPPSKPAEVAPPAVVASVRIPVPAPERVVFVASATPLSKPPELIARATIGNGIPPVLGYASDTPLTAGEGDDVLAETARSVLRGSLATQQANSQRSYAAPRAQEEAPLGVSDLGLEPPPVIATGDPDPFAGDMSRPDVAAPMLLTGAVTVRTMVFATFSAPNAKALPQLIAPVDLPGDNALYARVIPGPRTDRFEGSSIGTVQYASLP